MKNPKINTLVTHNRGDFKGIGCITKILKLTVLVNHGKDEVIRCNPEYLKPVDVSECKTITMQELSRISMGVAFKKEVDKCTFNNDGMRVIIGNEVKTYVGIGWVTEHVVTEMDLKYYPRLVD